MFKKIFWLLFLSVIFICLQQYTVIGGLKSDFLMLQYKTFNSFQNYFVAYYDVVSLNKTSQNDLQEENTKLKEQLELYNAKLAINTSKLQMADRAAQIENAVPSSGVKVLAKVNLDPALLKSGFITIDKGLSSGVSEGDGVINSDGVVGQVVKVEPETSQIRLITSKDAKIFAENESGYRFLVDGTGDNNKLAINHMDKNVQLNESDIIYTTGLDHVYPGKVKIAMVSKLFVEENGFNYVLCLPLFNVNSISLVAVLHHE